MNQPLLPGLATPGATRVANSLPDGDILSAGKDAGQQLFSDVLVDKIQEVIVDSESLSQADLIKQLLPEGLSQADAQKLTAEIGKLLGPEGQIDATALQAIIPLLPQGGKELPAATVVVNTPGLKPVLSKGLESVIRGQNRLPGQAALPAQFMSGLDKADLTRLVTANPQQLEQTITRFEQAVQTGFIAMDDRALVSQVISKFSAQASGEDKRLAAADGVSKDAIALVSGTDQGGTVRTANTASAGKAEFTLQQPMGKPEWNAELGQRILFMTKNNQQLARINLNPANMGPIEVRVNVQNDTATIMFGASHIQTREALEQALPRLRDMMAEQGFNNVNVDVSEHPHQQQERGKQRADGNFSGNGQFDALDNEPLNVGHVRVSQPDGAIDYFV